MELQTLLMEALKDRFIANSTIEAIEKRICLIAERNTFQKYKDKILCDFKNNIEFELIGVNARFTHFDDSNIELGKVTLELAYFCKSKLPKAKREKLAEAKATYKNEKYMPWLNYKVPIWKELRYSIEPQIILSNDINLEIRE